MKEEHQMKTIKTISKKTLSIFLAICTIVAMLPFMTTNTNAVTDAAGGMLVGAANITARMTAWCQKMNSKFWNGYSRKTYGDSGSEAKMKAIVDLGLINKANATDSELGITTSGCSGKTKNTGCRSNFFNGGSQCRGFARWVDYALFKSTPTANKSEWTSYTGTSLNTLVLQPGDHVVSNNHEAVVWKVEGNNVYFAEVWGSSACKIKFGLGFSTGGRCYKTQNEVIALLKSEGGTSGVRRHISTQTNTPGASTLTITGFVGPSGTYSNMKSFGLRGEVSSNYTITRAYAVLKDANSNKVIYEFSKAWNKTSFSIRYDGPNDLMAFGKIPAGRQYIYYVEFTDSSGKTVHQTTSFYKKS